MDERQCQRVWGKLAQHLRETIEEHKMIQQVTSLCSKAPMKDQETLEEKYKSKPEQLANIFKYARTMTCPVRRVKLWADPEFTLSEIDTVETTRKTQRTMSQESEIRPLKKAKAKARAKAVENAANGEDDPANPKIQKGEKTKLEKLQVKLNDLVAQIEALIGEMTDNGVSDMVPGYATAKALAQKAGAQDAASLIELSVTTGCGDATDLLKKGNDAVTTTKLAVATLTNLIHEAVAHLGA